MDDALAHFPAVARQLAQAAGFDLVGLASPIIADDIRKDLLDWKRSRPWGEMQWLGRHWRFKLRPARIGLAARGGQPSTIGTFLMLGINYRQSEPLPTESWLRSLARYARGGGDYHKILKQKCRELGRELETAFPGLIWRTLVDSAPIPEKILAQQAGLGWIAKNTLLINRRLGSYFFLASIAVDIPWREAWAAGSSIGQAAIVDGCRNCRACQDACPTGALNVAYQIDSERCISYWTIEQRSELNPEQSSKLNGWMFGCDICQEVCPHNLHRGRAESLIFALHPQWRDITLESALSWDENRWVKETQGTPLARTGQLRLKSILQKILQNLKA